MAQVPQTLKGFRDFLPPEKRARDFVVTKIKQTFELFGFEPIETPTLEYAALLLGKYGTEADKLVYTFTDRGNREVGLRYDQTVPTARVLTQNQENLPKYFRRYQIQNVFRADKPQRGRYREFTQCDVDIFGSTSPLADAEIIACTYYSFKNIGFPTIHLKINDRQTLLSALTPFANNTVSVFSIIQSIDKLDKQPESSVISELSEKGLGLDTAKKALEAITKAPVSENITRIIQTAKDLGVPEESIQISPTLARGLDYYTGMIFEVHIPEIPIGSFGGGGRYDNLINQLGGPVTPAVGIAFGFDRMIEGAKELHLIPEVTTGTKVLVTVFDKSTINTSSRICRDLRTAGFSTELYPSATDKLGKQFKHADAKQIPLAIVIGPEEVTNHTISIKNLITGKQKSAPQNQLISALLELE